MAEICYKDKVDSFMNISFVKAFLDNPTVNKASDSIKKDIDTIFLVLWWIAIIFWAWAVLWSLILIPLILISLWSFAWLGTLLWILWALLAVYIWYWLIKKRTFVPAIAILMFIISFVQSILNLIAYPNWIIWMLIWLAINIIFLTLILKNLSYFNIWSSDDNIPKL